MTNNPDVCAGPCNCHDNLFNPQLIVVTGGPGAGKTAVLEMAKKVLCKHVVILPEAASIVFGGGFWRLESTSAKLAAQRAIFHTQVEMETLVKGEQQWAIGLCDRGTLDGLAYWPASENSFWEMSRSEVKKEYDKYLAVIHLRSPTDILGYNQQNPLRIETAIQAKQIDHKIALAWAGHANYEVIESTEHFLTKAQMALNLIAKYIPASYRESLALPSRLKIDTTIRERGNEV